LEDDKKELERDIEKWEKEFKNRTGNQPTEEDQYVFKAWFSNASGRWINLLGSVFNQWHMHKFHIILNWVGSLDMKILPCGD